MWSGPSKASRACSESRTGWPMTSTTATPTESWPSMCSTLEIRAAEGASTTWGPLLSGGVSGGAVLVGRVAEDRLDVEQHSGGSLGEAGRAEGGQQTIGRLG